MLIRRKKYRARKKKYRGPPFDVGGLAKSCMKLMNFYRNIDHK